MRKAHDAKQTNARSMTVWGSGTPLREFLHVDDCAEALVFLAKYYSGETHINIGSGEEVSIRELAEMICEIVGFKGELVFDDSRPDGTPRKLADVGRLHGLGWTHLVPLKYGIQETYEWFSDHMAEAVAGV